MATIFFKEREKINISENVKQLEPLCTVGGGVKRCSGCGKHYGSSSKIKIILPWGSNSDSKELKTETQIFVHSCL